MKKIFLCIIILVMIGLMICISMSIYRLNVYTIEKVDKLLEIGKQIKSNNYYYEINRFDVAEDGERKCISNYKKYNIDNNYYEINTDLENENDSFEVIYDYANKSEYVISKSAINCNKNVNIAEKYYNEYYDYKLDISKLDPMYKNAFEYYGKDEIDGERCIIIGLAKNEYGIHYKNFYYINENTGLIQEKDLYSGSSYENLELDRVEKYVHKYDIVKETDIKTFSIDNYSNFDYYEVDVSSIDDIETLFNNIDVTYDSETVTSKDIKLIVSDLNEPKAESFEISNIVIAKNDADRKELVENEGFERLKETFNNEIKISWLKQYGELEKGKYLLNFDLVMNRTESTSIEKSYSVEFEIK